MSYPFLLCKIRQKFESGPVNTHAEIYFLVLFFVFWSFCFALFFPRIQPFRCESSRSVGNVVLQSSIQIFFNTFKLRVLVANVGAGFDFILLIVPQWNKSMKTLFSSTHRVPCGINVHLLEFQ